jgi:hypothetical protein
MLTYADANTQQYASQRQAQVLMCWLPSYQRANTDAAAGLHPPSNTFTCFTSTKVRIELLACKAAVFHSTGGVNHRCSMLLYLLYWYKRTDIAASRPRLQQLSFSLQEAGQPQVLYAAA